MPTAATPHAVAPILAALRAIEQGGSTLSDAQLHAVLAALVDASSLVGVADALASLAFAQAGLEAVAGYEAEAVTLGRATRALRDASSHLAELPR